MKKLFGLIVIIVTLISCESNDNMPLTEEFRLIKSEIFASDNDELLYSCELEYLEDKTNMTCVDFELGENETEPSTDLFEFKFEGQTIQYFTTLLSVETNSCSNYDTTFYEYDGELLIGSRTVKYNSSTCDIRSINMAKYTYDNDGRLISYIDEFEEPGGFSNSFALTFRYVNEFTVEAFQEDRIFERYTFTNIQRPDSDFINPITEYENLLNPNLIESTENFAGGDDTSNSYEFDEAGNITRITSLLDNQTWIYQIFTYQTL